MASARSRWSAWWIPISARQMFIVHWAWLDKRRAQNGTHIPPWGIAPYYFYYAHYYAAQVYELLPPEERGSFAPFIQAGILKARQKDGAMWDFWIASNSKPYGTAFGTLGLGHTEDETRD